MSVPPYPTCFRCEPTRITDMCLLSFSKQREEHSRLRPGNAWVDGNFATPGLRGGLAATEPIRTRRMSARLPDDRCLLSCMSGDLPHVELVLTALHRIWHRSPPVAYRGCTTHFPLHPHFFRYPIAIPFSHIKYGSTVQSMQSPPPVVPSTLDSDYRHQDFRLYSFVDHGPKPSMGSSGERNRYPGYAGKWDLRDDPSRYMAKTSSGSQEDHRRHAAGLLDPPNEVPKHLRSPLDVL